MALLFEPITIRKTTIKNRLWLTPMCQFQCHDKDGKPSNWQMSTLGGYAIGGFGLVMSEATGVSPEGRITAQCTGIWNDEQRDLWAPITAFIKTQGAVPAIQLAHAGRKASDDLYQKSLPLDQGGWETIGPSLLTVDGLVLPRVMVEADFDKVVADFVSASRRSIEAGFEVIEIHAAHGYLFHTFLSPLSNIRTDEYGGSLANRARFLLRVVEAVRAEIGPDIPLFVRLSASDWEEGGVTPEETAVVAEMCREHGADLADISSGGLLRSVFISTSPGYQVPFAETVKKGSGILTAAVGKITSPSQAESILEEGRADVIFVGRQAIHDPHFARRAAHELGVEQIEQDAPIPIAAGYWD